MADTPKRVLLVEDHRQSCDMLGALLGRWGFDVVTTYTQKSALETLPMGFDVIICDIALPDGTGYAIVREAKERQKHLLAIALSGYDSQADVEMGKLAGLDHHLTKPFDCNQIRLLLKAGRSAN